MEDNSPYKATEQMYRLEYKMVSGWTKDALVEQVNEYLKEGWSLYANPFGEDTLYQALTRYLPV